MHIHAVNRMKRKKDRHMRQFSSSYGKQTKSRTAVIRTREGQSAFVDMCLCSPAISRIGIIIQPFRDDCLKRSDTPACAGALQFCHTPENAVFFCKQFIGTAFLSDLSICQDDDPVGSLHSAHAMGDHQNSLSCKQP